MKFKIKYIIEGITNSIWVKDEVEKIANERYDICRRCEKNSVIAKNSPNPNPGPYLSKQRPDEHCTMCACNIHAKVRSLHTACPLKLWEEEATHEEAAKIAAAIDSVDNKL